MRKCKYCKIELTQRDGGPTRKKFKKNWPNYYVLYYKCENCGRFYYYQEDKKPMPTNIKLL